MTSEISKLEQECARELLNNRDANAYLTLQQAIQIRQFNELNSIQGTLIFEKDDGTPVDADGKEIK